MQANAHIPPVARLENYMSLASSCMWRYTRRCRSVKWAYFSHRVGPCRHVDRQRDGTRLTQGGRSSCLRWSTLTAASMSLEWKTMRRATVVFWTLCRRFPARVYHRRKAYTHPSLTTTRCACRRLCLEKSAHGKCRAVTRQGRPFLRMRPYMMSAPSHQTSRMSAAWYTTKMHRRHPYLIQHRTSQCACDGGCTMP